MERLLGLAKLGIVISLAVIPWFIPSVLVKAVIATLLAVIIALRDRGLAIAMVLTASLFLSFFCFTWLIASFFSKLCLSALANLATSMLASIAASFLMPAIVRIVDVVKLVGVSKVGLTMLLTLAILKKVPKFREIYGMIKINYGPKYAMLRATYVIGALVLEKSIEYAEQICLKIPEACLGGPDQPLHSAA